MFVHTSALACARLWIEWTGRRAWRERIRFLLHDPRHRAVWQFQITFIGGARLALPSLQDALDALLEHGVVPLYNKLFAQVCPTPVAVPASGDNLIGDRCSRSFEVVSTLFALLAQGIPLPVTIEDFEIVEPEVVMGDDFLVFQADIAFAAL